MVQIYKMYRFCVQWLHSVTLHVDRLQNPLCVHTCGSPTSSLHQLITLLDPHGITSSPPSFPHISPDGGCFVLVFVLVQMLLVAMETYVCFLHTRASRLHELWHFNTACLTACCIQEMHFHFKWWHPKWEIRPRCKHAWQMRKHLVLARSSMFAGLCLACCWMHHMIKSTPPHTGHSTPITTFY